MSLSARSVNIHLTRKCNFQCRYCFHFRHNDSILSLEQLKEGVDLLLEWGVEKINFSGGEPMLFSETVAQLAHYIKSQSHPPILSLISNGTHLTEPWLNSWGGLFDIIGVSCDSNNPQTLARIGRKNHLERIATIAQWCHQNRVPFKLNSVICSENVYEDWNDWIRSLNPFRWKILQFLPLAGEGARSELAITSEQFNAFLDRHQHIQARVAEPNHLMQNSYLILDEQLRFLNCQNQEKQPSRSILEIGVPAALASSGFDEGAFHQRGGIFSIPNLKLSDRIQSFSIL